MSTSICPSCELPFRSGKLVLVVDGNRVERRRVCTGCASRSIPLLFAERDNRGARSCETPGCKRRATFCRQCVADAIRNAGQIAAALSAQIDSPAAPELVGALERLRQSHSKSVIACTCADDGPLDCAIPDHRQRANRDPADRSTTDE